MPLPGFLWKGLLLITICCLLMSCAKDEKICDLTLPIGGLISTQTESLRTPPSTSFSIYLQDSSAYIGMGYEFAKFDISEPTTPHKNYSLQLSHEAESVIVVDHYAFVSDYHWDQSSTTIIDVSDPNNPVILECPGAESLSFNNASARENVIIAPRQQDDGLRVFEISNDPRETHLVELDSYQSNTLPKLYISPRPRIIESESRLLTDVVMVQDYLLVAANRQADYHLIDGQLQILDASNPAKLTGINTYLMPYRGSASRLFSNSNYLMIANHGEGGYGGLILDITDPTNPEEVELISENEIPLAIDERNHVYTIYVESGIATVRVRNLTNPNAINSKNWDISEYGWTFGWIGEVEVAGNYLYFVGLGFLQIVDVEDPFNPKKVSLTRIP